MNSDYPITNFEKFVANWAFKFTGLLFGLILIVGMFAPSIVAYFFGNYVFGMGSGAASAISTIAPQGKVIYVVMNILLAMLLHSERHRYFFDWDFAKPIREQIHGWHG